MSTTFTATIDHVHHTTSKALVRTHAVLVDRGHAKGGLDLGPSGGEYMLVSLGGCFTSHLAAAIRARDAAMSGVRVAVSGTMEGAPERFVAFSLDVMAECEDAELARKLVAIAARSCQVVNTLRRIATITITYAGVPVALHEAVAV